MSYIEFLAGAKKQRKADAHKFLKQYQVIPFSAKTLAIAEQMCRTVERGKPDGGSDLLIAGVAKEKGYAVYMANIKDFKTYSVPLIQYIPAED